MFDGPGVADLMSKVRDLCGAFNSSTQLMDRLKNIQLSQGASSVKPPGPKKRPG